MKRAACARCGTPILVPNTFNPDEDMEVCRDCEHDLMYRHDEGARE